MLNIGTKHIRLQLLQSLQNNVIQLYSNSYLYICIITYYACALFILLLLCSFPLYMYGNCYMYISIITYNYVLFYLHLLTIVIVSFHKLFRLCKIFGLLYWCFINIGELKHFIYYYYYYH